MFRFEKLAVWQKAVEYANIIYRITQVFPVEERFGLSSQLRRATVSVSSNIAEGTSRTSDTDLGRFVQIAYGSLMESVSELQIAKRQGFLEDEAFRVAYKYAEDLAKMLSGFRRTLREKGDSRDRRVQRRQRRPKS